MGSLSLGTLTCDLPPGRRNTSVAHFDDRRSLLSIVGIVGTFHYNDERPFVSGYNRFNNITFRALLFNVVTDVVRSCSHTHFKNDRRSILSTCSIFCSFRCIKNDRKLNCVWKHKRQFFFKYHSRPIGTPLYYYLLCSYFIKCL